MRGFARSLSFGSRSKRRSGGNGKASLVAHEIMCEQEDGFCRIRVTKGVQGLGVTTDMEGIVTGIERASPAADAGELEVGDRITEVDGEPLNGRTLQALAMVDSRTSYIFSVVKPKQPPSSRSSLSGRLSARNLMHVSGP